MAHAKIGVLMMRLELTEDLTEKMRLRMNEPSNPDQGKAEPGVFRAVDAMGPTARMVGTPC